MNNFYNIDDANKYLNNLKKMKIYTLIIFVFILTITTLLTIFTTSKIVMALDIIIYSLYFIYLDIYLGLIKKYYLARYHLLAKISNYDHENINTTILEIDNNETTLDKISYVKVKDNTRYFFIEGKFISKLALNEEVELDVVDNVIVGVK